MPDTMNMLSTFRLADNQDITRAGLQSYISALFPTADVTNAADKKRNCCYKYDKYGNITKH